MASMIRTTAVWTGAPGLPGYSQFYQEVTGDVASLAQAGHDGVRAFFAALVMLIPADITVTVAPIYQVITVASGELVAEDVVATPAAVVQGGYVGTWSSQVGVLVEWLTATFIGGRRLRGRTYCVPLGNIGDDDGTLSAGTLVTVRSALPSIEDENRAFVVWHRPVSGAGGQLSAITSGVVRDRAAILRSRML